jgi:hypothetical protein
MDDGRLVDVAFAVKVDLSACMSTEALVRRRYAKLFDRARMSSCLNCGYLRCSFRTFIVRQSFGCGAATAPASAGRSSSAGGYSVRRESHLQLPRTWPPRVRCNGKTPWEQRGTEGGRDASGAKEKTTGGHLLVVMWNLGQRLLPQSQAVW